MTVYIFTGPTLPREEARTELDAVYLPPVAQGDVYRATRKHPQVIGIIDGYFERLPAVWHKEILWAMSQGIHVFGAASMGALRAAELAPFGMEGVGAIYEAYREGVLEDDDEVAVLHGPADDGFRAQSEAMVNIRATFQQAERVGVITGGTREVLTRRAKEIFYPDRRYDTILAWGEQANLPMSELMALREWLPDGAVNQKRLDALAMLRLINMRLAAGLEPKQVQYHLERTNIWERARYLAGELLDESEAPETVLLDAVLDELRLDEPAYARAREATTARLVSLYEARRQNLVVTPRKRQAAADAFRRERGLLQASDVTHWLSEQEIDRAEFARLMADEARVRWVQTMTAPEMASYLPDYLRTTGAYAHYLSRARDKQHVLAARGLEDPSVADAALNEEDLLAWYFGQRLGREVPADPVAYAADAGFRTGDAFRRALLREYCYSELSS